MTEEGNLSMAKSNKSRKSVRNGAKKAAFLVDEKGVFFLELCYQVRRRRNLKA